ncbi:MAG: DUF362 domain-containing protein [Anaerolineaceae bacterium]|nr:DUF362 domain-containing protein [Anaerolineaceae bacterium]
MTNYAKLGKKQQAIVAIVRCEKYDPELVYEAVGQGLSLLGGIEQFASEGEKILLKPNLLTGVEANEYVTTHPVVFEAVARHFMETEAKVSFGDSPAFGSTKNVAKKAGLLEVAEELGLETADFSKGRKVSFHEGKLIKQFELAEAVLDCDGLITLPKFKTHALTRMTAAIKNQFGCIPGALKAEFHSKMTDVTSFSKMLIDLNRCIQPRLCIIDGIIAMEGNGPRNGTPRQMNVLIFSTDMAAADAVVSRMMNMDPKEVTLLRWAQIWELGETENIEILGEPLDSFIAEDFEVLHESATSNSRQEWMTKIFRQWVTPRPVINPEKCTKCGTCVRVCPAQPEKALSFKDGDRSQFPQYDYSLCIRCYCCQELCPDKAITVKVPMLGKLLH